MKLHHTDDRPSNELLALSFRGCPGPVLYRPNTTDISVAWEVLYGREYAPRKRWPFHTIVDCGANIGMFLAFSLIESGKTDLRYVGVEPDADAFSVLQKQVVSLGVQDKCHLLNVAAWDQDGTVLFDDAGPSWGHHVSESRGRSVNSLTIGTILDHAGIAECDLLKLDVEGGEVKLLESMGKWADRARAVVAELHNKATYEWFCAVVKRAGFTPFAAGQFFHAHPCALRNDCITSL